MGQDYILTFKNCIMSVFLLFSEVQSHRKNNGGVGPIHLLKRKQDRVGSSPAVDVCDFCGCLLSTAYVQFSSCTQSAVVSPSVWTFVMCIIL